MRIIGGNYKGKNLFSPNNKKTRPLKDIVRESIFNFLVHSNKIEFQIDGSTILDLFSGTGSFGLECLSRQADRVLFIEKDKEAITFLEKNIEKLKEKKKTKILSGYVFDIIKNNNTASFNFGINLKFDLIFCDPPFKESNTNDLLKLIIEKNLLNKNGIIILHQHKNNELKLKSFFKVIDERIYGLSKITFFQSTM